EINKRRHNSQAGVAHPSRFVRRVGFAECESVGRLPHPCRVFCDRVGFSDFREGCDFSRTTKVTQKTDVIPNRRAAPVRNLLLRKLKQLKPRRHLEAPCFHQRGERSRAQLDQKLRDSTYPGWPILRALSRRVGSSSRLQCTVTVAVAVV